ncbi:sensor histidine kinase [Nonomuraea sp. AD125B]|uniref:sensor histidine kinase n=1 Tax=Nonomuraea sp. AD125B TaxID=3242897 RepID=UPI003527473F
MVRRLLSLTKRLRLAHPMLVDGLMAVALTCGSWLWAVNEPQRATYPADLLSGLLTVAANLPLAWRRRAPFTVLLVATAAATVYHLLGYHYGNNSMGPLLALYSVTVHRPLPYAVVGAVLVILEWTHASAPHPGIRMWSAAGQAILVAGCACSIGACVRLLGDRNRQLADLAAQLHLEQGAAARRAVTHERLRIARELHDVVAHHMSVIAVQANLGSFIVLEDPPAARTALDTVADTSREAMVELRRLLSILRIEIDDNEDERYNPAPQLDRLDPLLARMRAAGISIEVDVTGTPRPLPRGLTLSAYRIIQEALTNVLKHAPGAPTRISVHYGVTELKVTVTNDGDPLTTSLVRDGHGLIGMNERVRLYDGTIMSGPEPGGGFSVRAVFPLPEEGDQDGSESKIIPC